MVLVGQTSDTKKCEQSEEESDYDKLRFQAQEWKEQAYFWQKRAVHFETLSQKIKNE